MIFGKLSGTVLDDPGLEIIDHQAPGNRPEELKGAAMRIKEAFQVLAQVEAHEEQTAVTKDHDKDLKPAFGRADAQGAAFSPIDLGAFPGIEVQLQVRRLFARPNLAQIIFEDGATAIITDLAQALEDLSTGKRVSF